MNKFSDNYNLLIEKLDDFIRKYYVNQLIRGVLYSIAFILLFFIVVAIAEYNFYFSTVIRKMLFYSFVGSSLFVLATLVFRPILKINRLGDVISHEKASEIIGHHFTAVKDKLLNILQLKNASLSLADASLIDASINQKSKELKPVLFSSAVDLTENKKYLKYALPPFLIFFAILFIRPNIIKDSTQRIVNNGTYYEKPMPFDFIINNESLSIMQFEDFKLEVSVEGEAIPTEIYLVKNDIKNATQKVNANNFAYVFTNLQDDVSFHLEAGGFRSDDFSLDVIAKPMITNFSVNVKYPNYLKMKNQQFQNTGDLSVPFGSSVDWIFDAIATENIFIEFSDTLIELNKSGKNQFKLSKSLYNSDKYIVKLNNTNIGSSDSSVFNISVIPDEYPQISVEEFPDSTNKDVFFYLGEISDDHGIVALNFNYAIQKEGSNGATSKYESIKVPFTPGQVSEFSHYWNLKEIGLKPGDKMNYFFQVWDNDGVRGSKSTRSKWMTFNLPSLNEMEDKSDEELSEIKDELKESIEKSKEMQEELKDLQEKLMQKKEISWEDKQQLEKILSEQKKLQNKVSEQKNKLENNIKKQNEFKEIDPEIQKKQEQLQKLFDEVLSDEMKAMIEKLEKMMEDLAKEEALDEMEDMEMNDEQLEKELDRMLELLKKLEFEQKLDETQQKLEDLAEKQEELSKESEEKGSDSEEIKEKQEKLNEEFKEAMEDLEQLKEMNEEMGEDSEEFEELEEQGEDTEEEMQDASDELSKGDKKKASESQKSSAEKMKEMAQKMSDMQSDMDMESMEEDMESLRQLLENLVKLSFSEEDLIEEFKITSINTPKYVSLIQDQFKLIDDSKAVEDSLYALASRMFQIEAFITDEIVAINRNLEKAVDLLEERKVANAATNQQYVMTGYNNLALMLSEVMSQMQQQMAESKPGSQMCEKPGKKPGSKPGKIPSLKQMQQQLNDQMSQMSEMMKEGSTPKGKGGQSKKLAEMAAKQQAIRQKLQDINGEDNKDGKGSLGNLQEIIEDMEQTETDLVNKQITNEMLKRQQEIMTKLLEAENAERQRDEKEERESKAAKQYDNSPPPSLKEYLKKREASIELYKALPPGLKPYYRGITEKYYKNIPEIN